MQTGTKKIGPLLVAVLAFFLFAGALNTWAEPIAFIFGVYANASAQTIRSFEAFFTIGVGFCAILISYKVYKILGKEMKETSSRKKWVRIGGAAVAAVFFFFVALSGQAVSTLLASQTPASNNYSQFKGSEFFPYEKLLSDLVIPDGMPEQQVNLQRANATSRCAALLYLLDENAKAANAARMENVEAEMNALYSLSGFWFSQAKRSDQPYGPSTEVDTTSENDDAAGDAFRAHLTAYREWLIETASRAEDLKDPQTMLYQELLICRAMGASSTNADLVEPAETE